MDLLQLRERERERERERKLTITEEISFSKTKFMNNIILNSQHGLHKSEKSVSITIYQVTFCKTLGK